MFWLSEGASYVQSSESGAEITVKKFVVPEHSMGSNGLIRYYYITRKTGGDGSATIRLYFGGVLIASYTISSSSSAVHFVEITIANRNSESSQYCSLFSRTAPSETGTVGTSSKSASAKETSIDTTITNELKLTAQLQGSDDTLYFRSHLLEREQT